TGNGFHIWFLCDDDSFLCKTIGGEKSYYKFQLIERNLCDHIELRWKNCQTVLPPSKHPSGKNYEFVNVREGGLPAAEPQNIGVGKLLEVIKEFCVLEEQINEKRKKADEQRKNNVFDRKILRDAAEFLKGKINNYDDFLRIGFSIASLCEDGREYFLLIGLDNPNYPADTENVLNKKFDGFLKDYRGDVTLGSFFHIAGKYGWKAPAEFKKQKKDWFELTKEILSYCYNFKYNELTQKLTWKRKDEKEFAEFSDTDLNTIYVKLRSEEKIPIGYEDLKRILSSDYVERFHPLIHYLKELNEWDGKDYIYDLAESIKCEDDDKKHWEACLRKWLVAVVACVLNDKEVNHTAIIFQGEQGIGKSRWIKKLIPEQLRDYLFTGNILPSDKDSKLAVVKNFIIDLDELETLNREEIGFLKSLMTQKEIQIRKPYGHYEEKYIRRSSFIGSVNKKEFLNDMTGTRRFLCFGVVSINADHSINMNNVFAQALHLYRNNYEYWFDKNDSDEITRRNEKFTFRPIEEEKILEKYEPIKKDEPAAIFLTTTEIAEKIFDGKPITNQMTRQIGMVMNKYKFEKMNKRFAKQSIKKWAVKEITALDRIYDENI
ncbi:MAG: virulence-associated E family protein, partial [Ignavibacteria bacterium]